MSDPREMAEATWDDFSQQTKDFSPEDFRRALEELSSIIEAWLQAEDEENEDD